ncbi:MAG: ATP-dependent DNA helicase RecG [Clostridia bacterium]|nr:ATP-dependent DNA helicase RecG [Clostridia bacterium]
MELTDIKGIGRRRVELLNRLGLFTLEDIQSFWPVAYIDLSNPKPVSELLEGENTTIRVRLVSKPQVFYKGKLSIVSFTAEDESGRITLRWFNQPYRANQLPVGGWVFATGRPAKKKGWSMANPAISMGGGGITPIYESCTGLSQTIFKNCVSEALERVPVYESLPFEVLERYSLMSRPRMVFELHRPTSSETLRSAMERRAFEEALIYLLIVEAQKDERKRHVGVSFEVDGIKERFLKKLPFEPTKAQLRVMDEVAADMSRPLLMNRLIQGDVGSGKTMIAEFALAIAAANGYQGAFMAPTEILARQHYETLKRLFGRTCGLLLGSDTAHERKLINERIRSGELSVVVGTHALLGESVVFDKLGLVVTDEQHRFGVAQRAKLLQKGLRPDTLVMSATPIPRTLSLILYGDLDLSVIDELPKGRRSVKTRFIPAAKRDALYSYLCEDAKRGNQSYVVCPLIESAGDSDLVSAVELYSELRERYPDISFGLLHGRMHESEKSRVMQSFQAGEISVLIATTVIEVGIDVKNAVNMVIESADRFGLATLHQLRGRVGRGDKQSYCFLLADEIEPRQNERISALLSTNDGFELSEMDLSIRGAGELLGTRQHGDEARWKNLAAMPPAVLSRASEAAKDILAMPSAVNFELIQRAAATFAERRDIVLN